MTEGADIERLMQLADGVVSAYAAGWQCNICGDMTAEEQNAADAKIPEAESALREALVALLQERDVERTMRDLCDHKIQQLSAALEAERVRAEKAEQDRDEARRWHEVTLAQLEAAVADRDFARMVCEEMRSKAHPTLVLPWEGNREPTR